VGDAPASGSATPRGAIPSRRRPGTRRRRTTVLVVAAAALLVGYVAVGRLPSGWSVPLLSWFDEEMGRTPATSDEPADAPTCPPFPQFPDQTCTGWRHTGVTLRNCPTSVTTENAILDGCRFPGGLIVAAPKATITRSLVEGRVVGRLPTRGSLGDLTLRDVELDGGGQPDSRPAIGDSDYTCIRCDVHGTGRGGSMGDNVHIEDSWFHDFVYVAPAHQTAVSTHGGSNNKVVHNNLSCTSGGCSAALSLYGDFGQVDDVLIEANLFNTTGSYCTYAGSIRSKPYPNGTNIRYLNNRFGKVYHPQCGIYGPVASWAYNSGNVWSGNGWADGSGAVDP
jgi:hypothetical protein